MESQHANLPLWEDKTIEEKVQTLKNLVYDLYAVMFQDDRERLINILKKHKPYDEKEKKDVEIIINMIKKYPNIFFKNCEVGHLIGSGLVIDLTSGNFLLHNHKTLNLLLQFGGHAECELNLKDVAMREVKEESGLVDLFFFPNEKHPFPLDIDMHLIPSMKNRPEHYHLDFRYLLATNNPNNISDKFDKTKETDDMIWISYGDAITGKYPLQPQLIRMIKKANVIYSNHISVDCQKKEGV